VLDSTPLYDAVVTMDTVTLLGSAIRGVLRVADEALAAEVREVLAGAEDYASLAKPQIDWDDQAARAALVDARARDAHAVLEVLQGRRLPTAVAEAARLLAAVVGQDLEQAGDGSFHIARKVAADRTISTVDPMPAMATRPAPAALTATRGMPRSTRQRAGHGDRRHRRECRRRGHRAAVAGRADRPSRRHPADRRRGGRERSASVHAHRLWR
jgi:hypothetical protein